jgi:hypothetical protein
MANTQQAIDTINQDNEELSSDVSSMDNEKLASLLGGGATAPKKAPETKKQKAAAATKTADEKALKAQIQSVQDSPWTQLSNALTKQYAQAETPTAALVSGSEGNTAEAGAANQALASLGLSSSSPAGSWLSAQTQAAEATAAPVSQAMAQEGAQYAAEAKPIESALAAGGQGNALETETAPEASWLQALASHVQSNLSYYGLVPTASLPSLTPGVSEALKLSGGYGGSAGSGTTPIQNVVADAATGGTKAKPTAGGALASAGSTGVIPGSSPAAGG